MARSDLLINLVKASNEGNREAFHKALESLIAEERGKHHDLLADRLSKYLRHNGQTINSKLTTSDTHIEGLCFEVVPERKLIDLVIPPLALQTCMELVEEQHRVELLRSANIEPRHRILLAGPPGNGKTSLAEAIAHELFYPLFIVRYEGIIGSYLGETAQRLKRLFEFVRTRRCVLFFDEFDAIGKERGDVHETGEIKRVVSSLLLQMDSLPSHVVIITASNHPELLDRAVWRRFQLRLNLPKPSIQSATKWFQIFEEKCNSTLGLSPRVLAEKLKGLSYSELEDFALNVKRREILNGQNESIKNIVSSQLKQYTSRFKPK